MMFIISLLLPLISADNLSKRHNSRTPNQHKSHSSYNQYNYDQSYYPSKYYSQNDDLFNGIPPEIRPPSGSNLLAKTFGVGTQNYKCNAGNWELESVNAIQSRNRHSLEQVEVSYYFLPTPDANGGQPTWMYLNDYSTFTGKPIAKATVDSNSIPWVVLTRTSGSTSGVFSKVNSVLRVHTKGGNPPSSGCQQGQSIRVGYTAEYWFFTQ
ncbi:hypothetical protein HDV06_001095 [Boothiomyces sp. JEL0866]|nr:hypothetical protein HDV06_001095 [Boothiomyces sp. JEL0866]